MCRVNKINKNILREYDIRGVFNSALTPEDAYSVGRRFASYIQNEFNKNDICLARDFRDSSSKLEENLIAGLINSGCEVFLIGEYPTPILYYSVMKWNYAAGIMITGSHNKLDVNGFKFFINNNIPFFGDKIKNLNIVPLKDGRGSVNHINVIDEYVSTLINQANITCRYRILWVAMSNTSMEVLTKLTKHLPGAHDVIKFTGKFSPDPTIKRNIKHVIKYVRDQKYDFTFIFDGDGDRLVVIDEKGALINSDKLLYIFALNLIKKYTSPTIIVDVKCSNSIIDKILQLGINVLVIKTGHAIIRNELNKSGALFAIEYSGHIFFKDKYYGFDDGIYAALRFLNIVSEENYQLNDLLTKALPKIFSTSEIRVDCDYIKACKIIKKMEVIIKKNKICKIDGVKISSDNYWYLIRKSNTENNIVIRFEANSKNEFLMVKNFLLLFLSKFDLSF